MVSSYLYLGDIFQTALELLQLRVFRLGDDEDGNVGVGVFPEGEELLVGCLGFGGVALHGIGVHHAAISFLTQKIKVGVTAGTRIDDCGKVPGKIVQVTLLVCQRIVKGDLQGDLGRSNDFTVIPGPTVNREFTTGNNSIRERLAVASRSSAARNAGYQQGTFSIGDGDLVDSSLFS